jgi:uncharacterized protein YuzE
VIYLEYLDGPTFVKKLVRDSKLYVRTTVCAKCNKTGETREVVDGRVFVDYCKCGKLIGIEILG